MDIANIRKTPELYKENQTKRFADPMVVDLILTLDTKHRTTKHRVDTLKALKNKLDKCFKTAKSGNLFDNSLDEVLEEMLNKEPTDLTKEQLKQLGAYITSVTKELDKEVAEMLRTRDSLIHSLGNLLNPVVPISNDEKDNITILTKNNHVAPYFPLPHYTLLEKLGFIDTEAGIKVCGDRGYFLKGIGVKLNIALMHYATDFLEAKGYTLIETPHYMNPEPMSQIAQLSEYDETLYKIKMDEDTHKYLIATSEQPMTAYFSNTVLPIADPTVKFAGISSCYRKEVGAHGRNTRGIFRVHQFTKVEQFCIVKPEESWEMFNKMIGVAQEFYDSLGISYRVISIVSGALNNAASMKYDLEAWFEGSNQYMELVSCTNCMDYFSRRIKTKYDNGEFAHMLNCTLCANTRTLSCLAETYQTKDGMKVPDVLKPYLGGLDFVKFVA
jgi:seryl-tRNA synthetase